MISEQAMYYYNTTKSKWIDYVGRSEKLYDNDMVVAVVHYTNQKGYSNGDLFFFVKEEEYLELKNAESIGSVYYHKWSMKGHPKAWYTGDKEESKKDDNQDDTNNNGDLGDDISQDKVDELLSSEQFSISDEKIDGDLLREAIKADANGSLETFYEMNFIDEEQKEIIDKWLDRLSNAKEMLEWTKELRKAIKLGNLSLNKSLKIFIRDIEGLFGVSFSQRFFYNTMNSILPGKLNPINWTKYKVKFKRMYDVLEEEGVKGASTIGKRILNSKNPLIKERKEFVGARQVYRSIKGNKKNWLEGQDAIEAIERYHKIIAKREASGVVKQNIQKLHIVNNKKGLKVRWGKEVRGTKKVMTFTKKVMRIVRFVIF